MDSGGIPSGAPVTRIERSVHSSLGPKLTEVRPEYEDSPGHAPPENDRRSGGGVQAVPEHLR
jgi:hypothetical protein